MNIIKLEGKTKESVLNKALEEANASEREVIYNIEEETKGLLKKSKYNIVLVTKEEIKNEIKSFILETGNLMNIKIETKVEEEDNIFKVYLESNNNSILIGKDGKTMRSLQTLVRSMLNVKTDMHIKVNIDVSGYREKQLNKLEKVVRKVAKEVINSKVDAKLDPMNSYERRFVHNIINEYADLETESVGEEPNRCTVIKYKD